MTSWPLRLSCCRGNEPISIQRGMWPVRSRQRRVVKVCLAGDSHSFLTYKTLSHSFLIIYSFVLSFMSSLVSFKLLLKSLVDCLSFLDPSFLASWSKCTHVEHLEFYYQSFQSYKGNQHKCNGFFLVNIQHTVLCLYF